MIIKRESLHISAVIGAVLSIVSLLLIAVDRFHLKTVKNGVAVANTFPHLLLIILLLVGVIVIILSFSLLRLQSITIE